MTGMLLAPRTTSDTFVSAARAAGVPAGRHAARADRERRLSPDVVAALVEAGFSRALVPARHGGDPTDFVTLTEAVAAVGEGCASAAWIGSLLAYTARFAAYLPAEGQAEIWADGPDSRLVSSLVSTTATALAADGGWRLSGTWTYASGVEFSDWALVMAMVAGADEQRQARFFAIPRDAYRIEETWDTVGMRATGSHTLVVEEVFVPGHRSFLMDDMFAGRGAVSDEPRHSQPLFAVNGLTFAAPVLGAARGALELSERALADKAARGTEPSEALRIAHARAAGEIDAAGLLLTRAALSVDRATATDEVLVRNRRDCALATQLLVGAVDALFHGGGTRSQSAADPLQRIWRDTHSAASHMVLQFEPAALAFTRGPLDAARAEKRSGS
ncbi:acyl-CoA dehydrogenase [Streptomyces phaeoluteigriseus]|uniref:Acyl-CoA dehydrogenase n=1 Tax=Streptomyces phaeoluteigriseus TaxID=114686 RepID=A0ABY4Z605_9ACTN|nr:acyl-CoA dehydrogenase family protein [Streptomyces phaeoluteigriseus]USQ84488.1 acyl-CoA dehydrogenase [Streptomyces phaeoluteigriseus]